MHAEKSITLRAQAAYEFIGSQSGGSDNQRLLTGYRAKEVFARVEPIA
jgi:hypothetical protein